MRQAAIVAVAITLAFAIACRRSATQTGSSTAAPAVGATASTADAAGSAQERDAVAALIGTTPPEWNVERWMGSPPLKLAELRGSVLLVRWWTAGCPYCSTSAPALRAFDREYGPWGLRVIGLYHHKETTPFEPRVYEATARQYGFTFPLAFDPDWRTLESWLRDAGGQPVSTGWTSITFVLDKRGVIRHVHPGGQYVAGDSAHAELRAVLERLLVES